MKQDNRPQSVLFVEGFANVQALYNFILNYKNIVSTVGLQAGIPPTILAPMAFHGATLTSNKVKVDGCNMWRVRFKIGFWKAVSEELHLLCSTN